MLTYSKIHIINNPFDIECMVCEYRSFYESDEYGQMKNKQFCVVFCKTALNISKLACSTHLPRDHFVVYEVNWIFGVCLDV